jgi:hypothetical protein
MMVKENIKTAVKTLIFLSITALPFLTLTNVIGIDTFLDSFENPENYTYFKNNKYLQSTKIKDRNYIIIQKSDHPSFQIQEGDTIMYCTVNGEIACHKIYQIYGDETLKKYSIQEKNVVYGDQIIGKVIKTLDNNIWNEFVINIWNLAINELNIRVLFD